MDVSSLTPQSTGRGLYATYNKSINSSYIYTYIYIPVVPHKAVAEVSKIENL